VCVYNLFAVYVLIVGMCVVGGVCEVCVLILCVCVCVCVRER
jgi:hypothetical protein